MLSFPVIVIFLVHHLISTSRASHAPALPLRAYFNAVSIEQLTILRRCLPGLCQQKISQPGNGMFTSQVNGLQSASCLHGGNNASKGTTPTLSRT